MEIKLRIKIKDNIEYQQWEKDFDYYYLTDRTNC